MSASGTITLEDLSNGVEIPQEIEKKTEIILESEEPTIEPEIDSKIEQQERTNLGRKFKALNNKYDTILSKLESLQTPVTLPDETDEFEIPTTSQENLDRHEQNELILAEKREKELGSYRINYMQAVEELNSDMKPEEYAEIFQEMEANYNNIHSWKDKTKTKVDANLAKHDAATNFQQAHISVLKKKSLSQSKIIPLHGGPNVPLDSGSPAKIINPAVKPVKLEGVAAEYARANGMSEESISSAMTAELPIWQKQYSGA